MKVLIKNTRTVAAKLWQNRKARYSIIAITIVAVCAAGVALAQPRHRTASTTSTPHTLAVSSTPTPSAAPSASTAPSNTPAARTAAKALAPVAQVAAAKPASLPLPTPNADGESSSPQAQAATSWFDHYAQPNLYSLSTDLNQMQVDANAGNTTNVIADCQLVYSHATIALTEPVAPDAQVNQDWVNAMTQFQVGATSCQDALGPNPDSASLQKFADAFAAAANYLNQLYDDISKL
jgi:hypothetical protein